jgi:hypothetical protein
MGWDAVVFGTLEVPAAKVEGWLTTPVAPKDFKGWPDFFADGFDPRPPEVLLEELKAAALEPHEFLELELDGGSLAMRAMLAKDPLLDNRMPLAVLWRSAAAHGGKGELVLLGYQTIEFGYRLKVGQGKSTLKLLSKAEQRTLEKGKAFKALDGRVQSSLETLLGKAKKKKGVNPFTGKPPVPARRAQRAR